MKKLRFVLILVVLVALPAVAIRSVLGKRHQDQRESAYRSELRSYIGVFKPGARREQVEGYLRVKEIKFLQRSGAGSYDDLVRIGQEDAPFFCEEQNVYVAFQFYGNKSLTKPGPDASDRLREMTILRWLEGCL